MEAQYPDVVFSVPAEDVESLLATLRQQASRDIDVLPSACAIYKEAIRAKQPRTQRDDNRILDKLGKKKLPELEYEDVTAITDDLMPSRTCSGIVIVCSSGGLTFA
jgi:hypothetical protein